MAVVNGQLVMTHDNLYYWKKDETDTHLINEGFTAMTQSLNPTTEDKQYIGDKNARTNTTGNNPNTAYSGELIKGDPFCEHIYELGKDQVIGKQETIIEVETWRDPVGGKYPARQYTDEVQPSNPGSGEGGTSLKMEGTLQQIGEVVKGMFDPATKEFTAN